MSYIRKEEGEAMAEAKHKKLTAREKKLRADAKKKMQEQGFLPPDKPRLNRKKYVEEARQEWNDKDKGFYAWELYLYEAVSIMLGATDRRLRVSPEAVGVAKCLKLAIRLKEFSDKLKAEGRTQYNLKEQIDFIKDILEA